VARWLALVEWLAVARWLARRRKRPAPAATSLVELQLQLGDVLDCALFTWAMKNLSVVDNAWLLDPPAVKPGTQMPKLGLTDEEATPINCGVATVICVTEKAAIGMGDAVVVQGLGLLGLYACAIAKARGARLGPAPDHVGQRRVPQLIELRPPGSAPVTLTNFTFANGSGGRIVRSRYPHLDPGGIHLAPICFPLSTGERMGETAPLSGAWRAPRLSAGRQPAGYAAGRKRAACPGFLRTFSCRLWAPDAGPVCGSAFRLSLLRPDSLRDSSFFNEARRMALAEAISYASSL
jgi:hypothetical protein